MAITLKRFRAIEAAVRAAGYGDTIAWTEAIMPPPDADTFAEIAIYVVCNSGLKTTVALTIYGHCMGALAEGRSVATVFGHAGKAAAIDHLWRERQTLFHGFMHAADPIAYCGTLPWVGPVTQHHLAKNLGVDTAKPDVHVARLAAAERTSALTLCRRLARQTGHRVATIDTILWRACECGILDSRAYLASGWRAGWKGALLPPS